VGDDVAGDISQATPAPLPVPILPLRLAVRRVGQREHHLAPGSLRTSTQRDRSTTYLPCGCSFLQTRGGEGGRGGESSSIE